MSAATKKENGVKFALRALRHRNYRLFFLGQGLSLIGTWISRLTTSWLVYRLTHSALMLGVVGFASQFPMFILTPLGGVLADRWDRRKALILTQVVLMITSLALAYFALHGTIRLVHVIVLSTIQGLANALDTPARQAFVVEMIEDRASISGAIALNSSMFNGARLIGPSIAGILIAWVGEGWCFLIDGVSFIFVIAALWAMRIGPSKTGHKKTHVMNELREGFSAAFGFAPIRAILLTVSLLSIFGAPYQVLMPIFAERILGGGSMTLGFLTGATGIGALIGAAYLAMRRSVLGLGRVTAICALLFGISMIGFGLATRMWLSVPFLALAGFGMMVYAAGSNTMLQTIVDDHTRGRVMSFFAMAFMGTMPLGSLLAGELARQIGAPATVVISGILCIAGALLFMRILPKLRPLIRPIYVARGILPPLPEGVGSTAELAGAVPVKAKK